jgi:hypothetical protein
VWQAPTELKIGIKIGSEAIKKQLNGAQEGVLQSSLNLFVSKELRHRRIPAVA